MIEIYPDNIDIIVLLVPIPWIDWVDIWATELFVMFIDKNENENNTQIGLHRFKNIRFSEHVSSGQYVPTGRRKQFDKRHIENSITI